MLAMAQLRSGVNAANEKQVVVHPNTKRWGFPS